MANPIPGLLKFQLSITKPFYGVCQEKRELCMERMG